MATLHINLEKLITEKLDEKINDAVSKAIEKAFSNISFDFIPNENYNYVEKESDESSKENSFKEEFVKDDNNSKIIPVVEEDSALEEVRRGWVEKMNAYTDIINQMKAQLTKEQLEQISIPKEIVSKKEYLFKLFIGNLSWEQVNLLFKSNNYLNIDIVSEDFEVQKIETYGFTPKDIYFKLLKQIITNEANRVYHLSYNDPTVISSLIVTELYNDYNSRVIGFVDDIIDKHHMEIFDEIFGEKFYMK
jgi:hypothetical protein